MGAQSGGTEMKRLVLVVVGCAWARGLAVALLLAGSLASSFAASSFTGLGSRSYAQAVSASLLSTKFVRLSVRKSVRLSAAE
jgi:hypothetical protein